MLTQVFSDQGVLLRSFGRVASVAAFSAVCTSVAACSGFAADSCAESRTCPSPRHTGGDTSSDDAGEPPISSGGAGGTTAGKGGSASGGSGVGTAGAAATAGGKSSGHSGGASTGGTADEPDAANPAPDSGNHDADAGSNDGTDGAVDSGLQCEADLASVKNCGACAHDCQGGACASGQCQPRVLAQGVTYPFRLVVDARYVYWLDQPNDGSGRKVMRAPVAGGGGAAVSGGGVGTGLATDGANVYWGLPSMSNSTESPNGELYSAPPGPASANLLQDAVDPSALAADTQNVYWADERANQVLRARRDGSEAGVTLVTGVQLVSSLKVDGTTLFGVSDGARSLFSVPVSGGGVTRLGSLDGGALGLTSSSFAVDATHVYAWFQDKKSVFHLEQLARATFAPVRELATSSSVVGLYTPLEYANDYVYYVQEDGVYRVSTTKNEQPTSVVKSKTLTIGMAVFGGALYWAENGSSTPSSVQKLAVF